MATETEPTAGNWYYDADQRRWLEVVDVDENDELVAVRYQDGEEDEYSLDGWYSLDLEPGEPPEDDDLDEPDAAGLKDDDPRLHRDWGHAPDDVFDQDED